MATWYLVYFLFKVWRKESGLKFHFKTMASIFNYMVILLKVFVENKKLLWLYSTKIFQYYDYFTFKKFESCICTCTSKTIPILITRIMEGWQVINEGFKTVVVTLSTALFSALSKSRHTTVTFNKPIDLAIAKSIYHSWWYIKYP